MEKMTIEKAREITEQVKQGNYITTTYIILHAFGFIEGYESRDAEIDRLKQQNEKMREALIEVKLHECTCHTGCGPCFNYFYLIAEDVLKYIGENE